MIIEENQLRPPSPKEMEARYVPLERVRLDWLYDCWDDMHCRHNGVHDENTPKTILYATTNSAEFSTLELIEFHKQWAIPYEAFLVNDGYEGEKALDWTHLVHCPVCQQWYEKDTDHANDTLHTAVEAGTARAPEEIPDNPFPKGDPRGWAEYSKCKSHICAAQRKHVEECVR